MEKLQQASPTANLGLTFKITAYLLGILAAAQIIAVVWKVLPSAIIRVSAAATQETSRESPAATPTQAPAPTTENTPFRPGTETAEAAPNPIEEAAMKEALMLFQEAQAAQRVGDWETALATLNRAAPILGDTAEIRLRRAFVLDRLGRESDSLAELVAIQAMPGISPDMRKQAAALADRTRQSLANQSSFARQNVTIEELNAQQLPPPATSISNDLPSLAPNGNETAILETFGLQPGADLGIIDVKEIASSGDEKVLRIAIKSRPDTEIAAADVKVHVQVFERTPEGDTIVSNVPVSSEWISPPVNWTGQEPEILDVTYLMPGAAGRPEGSADASNEYYGYIVGVYHNDELQDIRSVPGDLQTKFPLQLILED
ncbi:MAG: hypothetical protein ACK5LK_07615 [Chthoniobacterales bacterium]